MSTTTTTPSTHQLLLLADHLKLSLLERQRALSLSLSATKQDAHIARSLSNLHDGITTLERQSSTSTTDLSRLRTQYADLYAQYHGTTPPSTSTSQPNPPALSPDFAAAAQTPPSTKQSRTKGVRFRDIPEDDDQEDDPLETANRTALFSSTSQLYTDDPSPPPDQSHLSNHQIHTSHTSILRTQDAHLDTLHASISRQRMLGIQMGDELDEQNELLGDVERGVDRHGNRLEGAQRRLGRVARKGRENWSWVTIGVLVLVLVLVVVVLK